MSIDKSTLSTFAKELYHIRFRKLIHVDAWDGIEVNRYGELQCWPSGIAGEVPLFELLPEEEALLDDFVEDCDVKLLGVGSGRIAVEHLETGMVYKIARSGVSQYLGDGLEANKCEVDRYQSTDCQQLLPIYNYHPEYYWICMPKAERLDTFPENSHTTVISFIEDAVSKHQEIPNRDIYVENIGMWGGEWYLFDYGTVFRDEADTFGVFPSFSDLVSQSDESVY